MNVVIQYLEDESSDLGFVVPLDGVHGPFDSYDEAEGYGNSMGWNFSIREIHTCIDA